MAKRFGRNQRRAMREEISRIGEERSITRGQLVRSEQRFSALENRLGQWADDVLRLMGPDSAFNEQVRRMTVHENCGDVLRLETRITPSYRSFNEPPVVASMVIEALIWRLHMSSDDLSHKIRIVLENRHGEPVGYALHKSHVWSTKDQNYLAQRIADEMVHHLNKNKAAA